ncbi:MAG: MarC family NAAT transporter [Balneolales bacterium]|nr:MarC family NAAT transporter [Balneolales bacterium]
MISLSFLFTTFISIFAIVNPLTAMPVFLALTQDLPNSERNQQALRGAIYMVVILGAFLFGGSYIISFFGISIEGIRIAGGLMIMRFAYSLLNPDEGGRKISKEDEQESRQKPDISFSPLAMPLLSGPGSIAVVLGFGSQADGFFDYVTLFTAIVLVAAACFVVLYLAPKMVTVLGKTGMTALTRMMGFIALCIGVQFIINGIGMLLA